MNTRKFLAASMLALCLVSLAAVHSLAGSSPPYPSTVLKNQYGETSINSVVGGSTTSISFTVASTSPTGISGPTGNGGNKVYMYSSVPSVANPNPASGVIVVQLDQKYSGFVSQASGFIAPNSGTPLPVASYPATTAGSPYVITAVGTTLAADWHLLGLPAGLTPAIGQAFISLNGASYPGTGSVQAPVAAYPGTFIDTIGNPSTMVSATGGSYLIFRVIGPTSSSVTTQKAVAPTDGTQITLRIAMFPTPAQLH